MVKALFFDIFGTVVDWKKSLVDKCNSTKSLKNLEINWENFVINWRLKYASSLLEENHSKENWKILDIVHKENLEKVIKEMNIDSISEIQKKKLVNFWHQLKPWNDSCDAIKKLNKTYITCTLSNGNIALQKNLLKYANLDFDIIFSAEHFKKYKPNSIVYLGAVNYLGLNPEECALVASHKSDLKAAAENGLKTIFVERKNEYGKHKDKFKESEFNSDITITSLKYIHKELSKL